MTFEETLLKITINKTFTALNSSNCLRGRHIGDQAPSLILSRLDQAGAFWEQKCTSLAYENLLPAHFATLLILNGFLQVNLDGYH